ncbi:hypothetical protein ACWGI8_44305, partial [Streptomyces sp. NPDC054841]
DMDFAFGHDRVEYFGAIPLDDSQAFAQMLAKALPKGIEASVRNAARRQLAAELVRLAGQEAGQRMLVEGLTFPFSVGSGPQRGTYLSTARMSLGDPSTAEYLPEHLPLGAPDVVNTATADPNLALSTTSKTALSTARGGGLSVNALAALPVTTGIDNFVFLGGTVGGAGTETHVSALTHSVQDRRTFGTSGEPAWFAFKGASAELEIFPTYDDAEDFLALDRTARVNDTVLMTFPKEFAPLKGTEKTPGPWIELPSDAASAAKDDFTRILLGYHQVPQRIGGLRKLRSAAREKLGHPLAGPGTEATEYINYWLSAPRIQLLHGRILGGKHTTTPADLPDGNQLSLELSARAIGLRALSTDRIPTSVEARRLTFLRKNRGGAGAASLALPELRGIVGFGDPSGPGGGVHFGVTGGLATEDGVAYSQGSMLAGGQSDVLSYDGDSVLYQVRIEVSAELDITGRGS